MKFEVKFGGVSLKAYADKFEQFSQTAMAEGAVELNTRGSIMRKGMIPVLAAQTGLKPSTVNRALQERKASGPTPIYEIMAIGGNIALKYFKAQETAAGVSAAPWNVRQVYAGTFMKAGWWPHRVAKPNWNGQVFRRAGGRTKSGMDEFIKVKSGLFIADEMVKGATVAFFEQSAERIGAAIAQRFSTMLP